MQTARASAGSGPIATIAERYAGALFDLATEARALEAVESDLAALRKLIAASPAFKSFLASPLENADARGRAIAAIAEKAGFGELVRSFLGLVAKNRRLFALDAMAAAFAGRMSAHRGEVAAEAISATPLSDEQSRRVRAEIERKVGKAVNLAQRVDPDILGGLVVKVGSMMIDSSLKTKLNRIRSVMKRA
jgi:F-type H+-transporting ATPase subunit delta